LASGLTGTYGLIVPDISNPFFAALAHEFEDSVSATGRVVLLGDSAESEERENDLLRTLAQRRVDGLVLVSVHDSPDLSPLTRRGVPVVLLDRVSSEDRTASVAIDNFAAAREATVHLLEHGYSSVGHIAGPSNVETARARSAGWRSALAEAGVVEQPSWSVGGPWSRRGGFEAGAELLKRENRPRSIFVSNEAQAVGVIAAAASLGLGVPGDIAIMSFDGTDSGDYVVPRLSGVVQPFVSIARAAVELLSTADSRSGSGAPRHVVCDFQLRIRESCGTHN
jgi:LacI family transcriptional regulator